MAGLEEISDSNLARRCARNGGVYAGIEMLRGRHSDPSRRRKTWTAPISTPSGRSRPSSSNASQRPLYSTSATTSHKAFCSTQATRTRTHAAGWESQRRNRPRSRLASTAQRLLPPPRRAYFFPYRKSESGSWVGSEAALPDQTRVWTSGLATPSPASPTEPSAGSSNTI